MWRLTTGGRSHWDTADEIEKDVVEVGGKVTSRADVRVGRDSYPAVRITVAASGQGLKHRGVVYVVDSGDKTWVLDLSAPAADTSRLQPVFDRVLASFTRPYVVAWKDAAVDGMSISLPSTFTVAEQWSDVVSMQRGLGPRSLNALEEFTDGEADTFVMYAAQRLPDDGVAMVGVERLRAGGMLGYRALGKLAQRELEKDKRTSDVDTADAMMRQDYDAVRMEMVRRVPGAGEYRALDYIIEGGDDVWLLSFAAPTSDYSRLFTSFARSTETFSRPYVRPWKLARADGMSISLPSDFEVVTDPRRLAGGGPGAAYFGRGLELARYFRQSPQFFAMDAGGPIGSSVKDGSGQFLITHYPGFGLADALAEVRRGHLKSGGTMTAGRYTTVGAGYTAVRLEGTLPWVPGFKRMVLIVVRGSQVWFIEFEAFDGKDVKAGRALFDRAAASITLP